MEESHTHPTAGSIEDARPPSSRPLLASAGRRSRRRRLALLVPAVAVLAFGLGGCGGNDDTDGGGTETALTAQDARNADESVKAGARELVESIEICFKGSGDYSRCTTNRQLGATRTTLAASRPKAGEATISRTSPTGYRILTVSLSENRFAITKQGSSVIRSCAAKTPLGKSGGGCRGNGW